MLKASNKYEKEMTAYVVIATSVRLSQEDNTVTEYSDSNSLNTNKTAFLGQITYLAQILLSVCFTF